MTHELGIASEAEDDGASMGLLGLVEVKGLKCSRWRVRMAYNPLCVREKRFWFWFISKHKGKMAWSLSFTECLKPSSSFC